MSSQVHRSGRGSLLSLTADLCQRVTYPVADPGPEASLPYYSDDEYRRDIDAALSKFQGGPVWIFGYGSLIWRPPVNFDDQRSGVLRGWHRAFCLKTTRWRGTGTAPGLMMALTHGGSCRGRLLRLSPATQAADLETIWRREIGVKPANHIARLVSVSGPDGTTRALTFTANPKGRSYVGDLGFEATSAILSTAVGHWGSCADYLRQTVEALEATGIRDRLLWRLQEEVARRICENTAGEQAGGQMSI